MSRPTVKIDMSEFEMSIDKIMRNVERGIQHEILAKVSLDTFRNLQKATPRKTGRARAGWNTTIDTLPSEWKPESGNKQYSLTSFNGADTIKFNSVINMSNNVEYIVLLDEGRSQQAPFGMVTPVLARMQAHLAAVANSESRRIIK